MTDNCLQALNSSYTRMYVMFSVTEKRTPQFHDVFINPLQICSIKRSPGLILRNTMPPFFWTLSPPQCACLSTLLVDSLLTGCHILPPHGLLYWDMIHRLALIAGLSAPSLKHIHTVLTHTNMYFSCDRPFHLSNTYETAKWTLVYFSAEWISVFASKKCRTWD